MSDGGSTAVITNIGIIKDARTGCGETLGQLVAFRRGSADAGGEGGRVRRSAQRAVAGGLAVGREVKPQQRTADQIQRNNEYSEIMDKTFFK